MIPDGCGVSHISERSNKTYRVPSTPGPFGATLCKQERAFLKAGKCLLLIWDTPPVTLCSVTAPSYEGAKGCAGCKKSPEPIGSGGFLFFFSLREQVGHALQADAQGGHIVKQGRSGGRQKACHAADDEGQVEAHDKAVIPVDPVHQRLG